MDIEYWQVQSTNFTATHDPESTPVLPVRFSLRGAQSLSGLPGAYISEGASP